jgi:hypothetical protein
MKMQPQLGEGIKDEATVRREDAASVGGEKKNVASFWRGRPPLEALHKDAANVRNGE